MGRKMEQENIIRTVGVAMKSLGSDFAPTSKPESYPLRSAIGAKSISSEQTIVIIFISLDPMPIIVSKTLAVFHIILNSS